LLNDKNDEPKATKNLNDIVKKRKQEQEQEQESKPVSKVLEVNVDMLLDAIPDEKVNKRKDGFEIH